MDLQTHYLFAAASTVTNPASEWTAQTTGGSGTIRALTYGNSLYALAGDSNNLYTSSDAVTWTSRTSGLGGGSSIISLGYGNGLYLLGWLRKTIITSSDGATWTLRQDVPSSDPEASVGVRGFTYTGSSYYAVGGDLSSPLKGYIWSSLNGTSWTEIYAQTPRYFNSVAYGNGSVVAVGTSNGSDALIIASTDGVNWFARNAATTSPINQIIYANSRFVYVGNNGTIGTSSDGITWTSRSSGTTSNILSITYGNDSYVYGAANGNIGQSNDATTWTTAATASGAVNALTFGNGLYLRGVGSTLSTSD